MFNLMQPANMAQMQLVIRRELQKEVFGCGIDLEYL
jgi:hypothetical protein